MVCADTYAIHFVFCDSVVINQDSGVSNQDPSGFSVTENKIYDSRIDSTRSLDAGQAA